ncbi:hypothetical protein [Paenibacillus monticola]|uniref:Uncharacterized protein n=1 Tax=Paenibacillus monticola TaxID=2666075 RepID=A0A7X2H9X8_9BACL|nr:hypothetical protein [Paenibacillus monticola]MRN56249.1 hypothetical protein [Paenibacillus monticola]
MNNRKTYVSLITVIYAAVIIVTVFSFFGLGFSESLLRFVISLAAVLFAESVVYGYSIFWQRVTVRISQTSPVMISGAFITVSYVVAVLVSAIVFDWLLEIPPLWYAALQLLIVVVGAASLAATGLYGWNAGAQEKKARESTRGLRQHQQALAEICIMARSWKHSENKQLVELIDSLEEKFKYSDPVSNSSLFATEDMLNQQISLLHDHVELLLAVNEPRADWEVETKELVDSIAATLQRRNRELLVLK